MTVLVFTEHRFLRTPDGVVWTGSAFAYPFWLRYLDIFSAVRVVARVLPVQQQPGLSQRADGPGVEFHDVPYFVGPGAFFRHASAVRAACLDALERAEAVILRVPSILADCVSGRLFSERRAYAVEVVGDPFDVFSPGALRHPLRPLLRLLAPAILRRQCHRAPVACYVTEAALQRRYPAAQAALATACSDVELPPGAFVDSARSFSQSPGPRHLVTIGALDHLYKGQDLLIQALSSCVTDGLDLQLHFVGDGRFRPLLESKVAPIRDRVTFHGFAPSGEPVRRLLDSADLFVLPSRQEGLPRAMVEAMARALPCIGADVGGIPELLSAEDLIPPNDAPRLAALIKAVVSHPARLSAMSARNLLRAADYGEEMLRPRRNEYLLELRERTQDWLRGTQRSAVPHPPNSIAAH